MPVEQAKEAAKIVVETSGAFSSIWHYIISALGVGIVGIWGHITGRIKGLEESAVSKTQLDTHTKEENEKFDNLFSEVRVIGKAVARIEGKLDK